MYEPLKLKAILIKMLSINNAVMVGKFRLLSVWDSQDTHFLLYMNRFTFGMKLIGTNRINKESIKNKTQNICF